MKKLSVIVPVYNVEAYLAECVESLMSQSYENIEVILVDDGAKDGSGALCDALKEKYSHIIVIHQQNQGLPAARNAGMQRATGDYIAFLDSDDYVAPNMYEELMSALEKHQADVAICNYRVFNKETYQVSTRYRDAVIAYSDEMSLRFYQCSMDSSCNRVFRRKIMEQHHVVFESKKIVPQEDYYFQMKYFTHAARVVSISEALYNYRERGSSISHSGQDDAFSQGCLELILRSRRYIAHNSTRSAERFLEYQHANMLLAAINGVTENSVACILSVMRRFAEVNRLAFGNETREALFGINTPHASYYCVVFKLLTLGMYRVAAMMEHMRLKRLRSHVVRGRYYE